VPTLALPAVSALTAGILIVLQMLLLLTVVLARRSNQQSLGDGGNANMLRSIRRHGNLAENAAIFVVCAALLEMLGESRLTMEILCGAFVLARLSHAIGLSFGRTVNIFRFVGTTVTVAVSIWAGVLLIQIALPLVSPGGLLHRL
jgi:uncharacterized membrane protein YecN with MAPEG domain